MRSFVGSLTILGIVSLIGMILYQSFKPELNQKSSSKVFNRVDHSEDNEEMATTMINQLTLQVLSPKRDIVEKEVDIPFIPKSGLSIGKSEECQIQINKDVISKNHCMLGKDDKGLFLKDSGSTNGIFNQNDLKHKVSVIDVKLGDVIYLANVPVKFIIKNTFESVPTEADAIPKTKEYAHAPHKTIRRI